MNPHYKIVTVLIGALVSVFFVFHAAFALPQKNFASIFCVSRVLFQDKILQRVYDDFVREAWPLWHANPGRELGAFTTRCEPSHQLVIGLSDVADPLPDFYYSAFLYMRMSPRGYVPRAEASQIVSFGRQASEVLPQISRMSRIAEYIKKIRSTRGVVVANAPQLNDAPIPEGFSGITFDLFQSYIPDRVQQYTQYLAYDWQSGTLWYRLPLDQTWESFPEIAYVTAQYTQAAAAVSENCTVKFTEQDFISGYLSSQSPARFVVNSTLRECPKSFEVDLTSNEFAALVVGDSATSVPLNNDVTQTSDTNAPVSIFTQQSLSPFFADFIIMPTAGQTLTSDPLIVPRGLLTLGRLQATLFLHFQNILALLLFSSGTLIFALVFHSRLVYPKTSSQRSPLRSNTPEPPVS